jgi:ferredoxin-fold anticodon binding domain-containing protein
MKLETAKAVLAIVDIDRIRQCSLSNLARWKTNDVWCSAFDEWKALMKSGTDDEVIAAMTGENENSNRLRQSSVWTGLLDQKTVLAIKVRVAEEFGDESLRNALLAIDIDKQNYL